MTFIVSVDNKPSKKTKADISEDGHIGQSCSNSHSTSHKELAHSESQRSRSSVEIHICTINTFIDASTKGM